MPQIGKWDRKWVHHAKAYCHPPHFAKKPAQFLVHAGMRNNWRRHGLGLGLESRFRCYFPFGQEPQNVQLGQDYSLPVTGSLPGAQIVPLGRECPIQMTEAPLG